MDQISRRWTEDEVNFLSQNYLSMSDQELGDCLKRTKDAIERKRARLKLKKMKSLILALKLLKKYYLQN